MDRQNDLDQEYNTEDLEAQLAALGLDDDDDATANFDDLAAQLAALGLDDESTGADLTADAGAAATAMEDMSVDDLEAQLAALGLFSEDDKAGDAIPGLGADAIPGLEGFNFDDDPDAAFAALEALAQPGDELDFASMPSDAMDLDKQLELLLQADQNASESFEVTDFVGADISHTVYDPEVDGRGSVRYVKDRSYKAEEVKKKLFEDIKLWQIALTAVLGLFFIGIVATAAIVTAQALAEQQVAVDAVAHFLPIEMPHNPANNSNAIFLNHSLMLNNQRFTLTRMSVGFSGTFLFFAEVFDPADYIFLLYNQARNLYVQSFFDINRNASGTVLKFDTLSSNTLFLTLHIQCVRTNNYANFNYRFLAPPIVSAPVFVSAPSSVHGLAQGRSAGGLIITSAVFDDASSKVYYSFEELDGTGLRARDGVQPTIALRDTFVTATNFTGPDIWHHFDDFDITISSATFSPVLSLDSTVNLIFSGLEYFFPNPQVHVLPQQLFGNDQLNPFSVPTGEFTLNLEGMAQQGRYIVLTLHGLDENNLRVETDVDATLQVRTPEGYVYMQAETFVTGMGTDVVFDMFPYGSELRGVPISEYALIINHVVYDAPNVSHPIVLSTTHGRLPSTLLFAAQVAVLEAFHGLLTHRSGEVFLDGIVGLGAEFLQSSNLYKYFEPQPLVTRAMYGATLAMGDMISNYDFLGIVDVQWVSGIGADISYFYGSFEVVARSTDGVWSVVDINMIED